MFLILNLLILGMPTENPRKGELGIAVELVKLTGSKV